MVGQLIKLLDLLNMRTDNGLLFLEYSDIAINFNIGELLVLEVLERSGNLVFALMIEQNVECACVIVDFELSSHWFFDTAQDASAENDIVDGISVIFAHIIWSWLSICDHLDSDRSKHLCLSPFCTLILIIEAP